MEQITLDILWNRLVATVNEQAAALMRSSFTSIVRESGDLSAGVFDRRGRMIAQAVTGTPGHINSMATGMVHFLTRFPVDTLRPGDVLATNDPWKTASQLNDITVATPVFRDGRLVAFFANTCHALDIGGRGLSADARSVFEEGLSIPMMKLHDAGRPVEPLYELIAANVRTPEEVLGDLHSQVVGNEVGARQLIRFLDEFSLRRHRGVGRRDRHAVGAGHARADRRLARRRVPLRAHDRRLRAADRDPRGRPYPRRRADGGFRRELGRGPPRHQRGAELHAGLHDVRHQVRHLAGRPEQRGQLPPRARDRA